MMDVFATPYDTYSFGAVIAIPVLFFFFAYHTRLDVSGYPCPVVLRAGFSLSAAIILCTLWPAFALWFLVWLLGQSLRIMDFFTGRDKS